MLACCFGVRSFVRPFVRSSVVPCIHGGVDTSWWSWGMSVAVSVCCVVVCGGCRVRRVWCVWCACFVLRENACRTRTPCSPTLSREKPVWHVDDGANVDGLGVRASNPTFGSETLLGLRCRCKSVCCQPTLLKRPLRTQAPLLLRQIIGSPIRMSYGALAKGINLFLWRCFRVKLFL